MEIIRQPIVVVLGHVDHGKTMILDCIRSTSVHKREKGAITQHIGASEVPSDVIRSIGKGMLERMGIELKIPGLLFIDTPGHEAFTSLRRRGGSIADIAVLVVDAMQGIQPQTAESIEILKQYKTPFVVAMNKIDLIDGWKPRNTFSVTESISLQGKVTLEALDKKLYGIVGKLGEKGFNSERFDRISDFTREVSIIPVSAKTGEGISELLILLSGMSQKYLEKRLHIDPRSEGKASIIEVKEEPGLGKTVDAILYDGTMRVGDSVAFAAFQGAKVSHVRALLRPKPLDEMRDPKDKFISSGFVSAAAGVKIACPGLEDAVPGSAMVVVSGEDDPRVSEVSEEVSGLLSYTEGEGVIVKADTLGSLEAAIRLLSGAGVRVGRVGIGAVSRKDLLECTAMRERCRHSAVVLAFNVRVPKDVEAYAKDCRIPIFTESVIYLLVEKFFKWRDNEEEQEKRDVFGKLQPIGSVRALPGCCFRASKPAVFGVKIEGGKIRPGALLVDENGKEVGRIRNIQHDKESLQEACSGMEVAVSVEGAYYGKDIVEGKRMYTYVPKHEADVYLEKYSKLLSSDEVSLLTHIMRITKQKLV